MNVTGGMTRTAVVAALMLLGCTRMWMGVAASAGTFAKREDDDALLLAVLRRDGLAAPFAAFDGRRWSSPWPESIVGSEVPISLGDVPKRWWGIDTPPQRMTLWRDGTRAGDVALTGITTMPLMCVPRAVLRTDFKTSGPLPSPRDRPFPKEGLLAAGKEAAVGRILTVAKGSAEWNTTVLRLTEKFDDVEDDAVNAFTNWRHPVRPERRKLVPITLEAAYTAETDTDGWRAYYVEAVRQYQAAFADKDKCGLVTFVNGWILVDAKNESKFFLTGRVTYCDRHRVTYMLPLGLITADAKKYWVFQSSGFDNEWYEVARPAPRRVESHVAHRAGTCE